MSRRRLVRSGNTSFTLSLPIDWVRKHGLDAGDEVEVQETGRGSLLVQVERQEKKSLGKDYQDLKLQIDGLADLEIETQLQLAYIQDVDAINVEGKELPSKHAAIARVVQDLIGLDIMDQGKDYVKIKDFFVLDEETQPQNILHKMTIINRAAFDSIQRSFKEGASPELVHEVDQFSHQNKKLASVAHKSIMTLISEPARMREFQLDTLLLMKSMLFTQAYRRIATRLAHIADTLSLVDLDSKETKLLASLLDHVKDEHEALLVDIAHSDRDGIRSFMVDSNIFDKRMEDATTRIEEVFHARVVDYLHMIHSTLQEVAFTASL